MNAARGTLLRRNGRRRRWRARGVRGARGCVGFGPSARRVRFLGRRTTYPAGITLSKANESPARSMDSTGKGFHGGPVVIISSGGSVFVNVNIAGKTTVMTLNGKTVLPENAQQRTEVDKPAPKRSRYENAERDVTPQESARKPADRGLHEQDEGRGSADVTQGTTSGSIIMSSPGGFHATWWTKDATALPRSVHASVSEMGKRGYCITSIGKELEGTSVVIVNDSVNINVTTGEGPTDRDVAMTRERKRHREDEWAVKVGDRTRVKYCAEEIDEPSPKRSTRDAHDPSQEKPEDTSGYCCVEDARRCRSTHMLRDAKRAFLQALIDKVRSMKLPEEVIADVEKLATDATLSMGLSVFGESRTPYGAVIGFLVSIGAQVTEKLPSLPSFVSLAKAQQAALYKAVKDAIVCVADTLFTSAPSQPNGA